MKNIGMVSEKLNRNTLKCCLSAKLKEFALAKVRLIVLPSLFLLFQVRIDTFSLLLKYLWFSQTERLGHSEALRALNLRRFLALRLLLAMCK